VRWLLLVVLPETQCAGSFCFCQPATDQARNMASVVSLPDTDHLDETEPTPLTETIMEGDEDAGDESTNREEDDLNVNRLASEPAPVSASPDENIETCWEDGKATDGAPTLPVSKSEESAAESACDPGQDSAPTAVVVTPARLSLPQIPPFKELDSAERASSSSKRESIRAKLRAQEERLKGIVKTTTGDDGTGVSLYDQMIAVKNDIKQMEETKSELEKELAKLQSSTPADDEFLNEKMSSIQAGFDQQVAKIQSLQDELVEQKSYVSKLHHELVNKVHRVVELEFDLETHDVHFTAYASEQFKLGEEALAEIRRNHSSSSSVAPPEMAPDREGVSAPASPKPEAAPVSTKKAQKLISKLLSDLDNLELRYKQEKLQVSSKLSLLEEQNEGLRVEIEKLKNEIRAKEESNDAPTTDGTAAEEKSDTKGKKAEKDAAMEYLRQRVELLEAQKVVTRLDLERSEKEIRTIQKDYGINQHKLQREIRNLQQENELLRTKLGSKAASLPDAPGSPGGKLANGMPPVNEESIYASLAKRIHENHVKTAVLEATCEIKDRKINSLKKEITNYRLKEIAQGNLPNGAQFDTELLQKHNQSVDRAFETGGSENHPESAENDDSEKSDTKQARMVGVDPQYVKELQRQLRDVQQAVVKKDQELVIERAKAASTAAGLLARITELTSRNHDLNRENRKSAAGLSSEQLAQHQASMNSSSSFRGTMSSAGSVRGGDDGLSSSQRRTSGRFQRRMSNRSDASAATAPVAGPSFDDDPSESGLSVSTTKNSRRRKLSFRMRL
jgi:DNA repair exonuclease SbcCD ATPase subunit